MSDAPADVPRLTFACTGRGSHPRTVLAVWGITPAGHAAPVAAHTGPRSSADAVQRMRLWHDQGAAAVSRTLDIRCERCPTDPDRVAPAPGGSVRGVRHVELTSPLVTALVGAFLDRGLHEVDVSTVDVEGWAATLASKPSPGTG